MSDVTITITRETTTPTQAGFGLPLVVGTSGAQDYAECVDLTEVVAAGHADTTEVYKMAQAIFSQNPRPEKVAVVGFADAMSLESDLNSLITEENDWYFLLSEEQGSSEITELSGWAAANNKLYFAMLDDDVAANAALADTLASERTALIYHDKPGTEGDDVNYADAAWVGKCAPLDPGSITWKFKTLAGIEKVSLSTTDIGTLHDANVNTYIKKLGVNQTSEGKTTEGEYIDVIRSQDFIESRLNERISMLLINSPKVPYDVRGIAMVISEVEAVMQQATAQGIIARDEDGNGIFTVSAPDIADISDTDKGNRHLPDVNFELTLAGAIHSVTIKGVISL